MAIAVKYAIGAGEENLKIYKDKNFQVSRKEDKSPITLADKKAHQVIKEFLSEYGLPILSEEGKTISYQERFGNFLDDRSS